MHVAESCHYLCVCGVFACLNTFFVTKSIVTGDINQDVREHIHTHTHTHTTQSPPPPPSPLPRTTTVTHTTTHTDTHTNTCTHSHTHLRTGSWRGSLRIGAHRFTKCIAAAVYRYYGRLCRGWSLRLRTGRPAAHAGVRKKERERAGVWSCVGLGPRVSASACVCVRVDIRV